MRSEKRIIYILGFCVSLFVVSACGPSDREKGIIEICQRSAGSIDAYDESGEHYSKTAMGKVVIRDVCEAKAELYVEGYRISSEFYIHDIKIYRSSIMSEKSLTSIYKKAIKEGAWL